MEKYIDLEAYPTPYYIVYEDRLRSNLDLISRVATEAGVKIIMAFKANALWRTFGVMREYRVASTASSLNEMQLANDELGCLAHTYCPAYTAETIGRYLAGSSHITFNSVAQAERFRGDVERFNATGSHRVSCGLRVNPMCSVIETDIYNPCCPGSRFGVTADELGELPDFIEGFHFHALCESTSYDLERVLDAVEEQFGQYLPRLKWINMGGGHLMTRQGYDTAHLVNSMRTRSSLVSTTMVSLDTDTILPTMPPMVVMTSPFFRLSRISCAFFFRLFSGRIIRKYMMATIATIKIRLPYCSMVKSPLEIHCFLQTIQLLYPRITGLASPKFSPPA